MNLDIQKIVQDKIAEMDAAGVIQKKIEDTIESTIMKTISAVFGGYEFMRSVKDEIENAFPGGASNLGLDAWARHVGNQVRDLVAGQFDAHLADSVAKAAEEILQKKTEPIRLSEIVDIYRKDANYYTEEEERREKNDDGDGFTMKITGESPYGFSLELDEDNPPFTDPDIQVRFTYGSIDDGGDEQRAYIRSIFQAGRQVTDLDIPKYMSTTMATLIRAKINWTPIIVDKHDIDWEDHYYDVEEY